MPEVISDGVPADAANTHSSHALLARRRNRDTQEKRWLEERLPDFIRAQAAKKIADFWPTILRDYFSAFPVPGMTDPNLDLESSRQLAEELQRKTVVSFYLISLSACVSY